MSSRTWIKKEAIGLALLISAASGIACNAEAMAKKPPVTPIPPAPVAGDHNPLPVPGDPIFSGRRDSVDFRNGYAVGEHNGALLAERIRQRTLDERGCDGMSVFEKALLTVTRTVRPPADGGDLVVAGFFQGYIDALKAAVDDARTGCGVLQFTDGSFVGSFYASVFCQVQTTDPLAVSEVSFDPIYSGWSGGSTDVINGCQSSFVSTATACVGDSKADFELALASSCSDGRM